MGVFSVFCTAEVPVPIIEKFLEDALIGSNELVPNSDPCLAIVTTAGEVPTKASKPPLGPFTSPFIGQSVEDISRQLDKDITYFVILDERTANDETVTLGERGRNGSVQTVRADFKSAQSTLTALKVGSIGFEEIRNIAASKGDVYRLYYEGSEGPKKGGQAPRMRLGG